MAKNEEKAKKKREKMGLSEDYIKKAAQIKTKSIDSTGISSASITKSNHLSGLSVKLLFMIYQGVSEIFSPKK